jgi:glycosyltransferase involved in cell wall biosynthesis
MFFLANGGGYSATNTAVTQVILLRWFDCSEISVMTKNDLVSVIIPVHNGERFIGRTLASARAQSYAALEIIVIDDGSTDQTASIVEAIALNDNRVRLFRISKTGVAAARNLGITESGGDLIAPLDADDLWHPEKIARQVALMNSSSADVGVVYCWSIEIDEHDFLFGFPTVGKTTARGRVTAELAESNFIQNSSAPLIKRSLLRAVGGYDTNLIPHGAEDWKLYLELSSICEFAVLPEYLVGYRQHTSSLSRDVAGLAHSIELVSLWIAKRWPDLPDDIRRKRLYNSGTCLAERALDKNQFRAALWYGVGAYRARPEALFGRWTVAFGARFLFRLIGLRRSLFKRVRPRAPISFARFNSI